LLLVFCWKSTADSRLGDKPTINRHPLMLQDVLLIITCNFSVILVLRMCNYDVEDEVICGYVRLASRLDGVSKGLLPITVSTLNSY